MKKQQQKQTTTPPQPISVEKLLSTLEVLTPPAPSDPEAELRQLRRLGIEALEGKRRQVIEQIVEEFGPGILDEVAAKVRQNPVYWGTIQGLQIMQQYFQAVDDLAVKMAEKATKLVEAGNWTAPFDPITNRHPGVQAAMARIARRSSAAAAPAAAAEDAPPMAAGRRKPSGRPLGSKDRQPRRKRVQ